LAGISGLPGKGWAAKKTGNKNKSPAIFKNLMA
jgi:hypothetical protein